MIPAPAVNGDDLRNARQVDPRDNSPQTSRPRRETTRPRRKDSSTQGKRQVDPRFRPAHT